MKTTRDYIKEIEEDLEAFKDFQKTANERDYKLNELCIADLESELFILKQKQNENRNN